MSSQQAGCFAVDLSDQEAWDDTLLIEAYDRAIRSYQVCCGAVKANLPLPCARNDVHSF